MVDNIFTHEIFADYILPWILVFVIVFAVLEKTKVLGDGKKQINAIVAVVLALLLLGFESSRDVITGIVPYAIVAIIVVFVFLLIYGFLGGDFKEVLGKGSKIGIAAVVGIALLVLVLVLTNVWDKVIDFFSGSSVAMNIIFIVIAAVAIIAVIGKGK